MAKSGGKPLRESKKVITRSIAIHEAAHAVADFRFNFTIDSVTIIPDVKRGVAGAAKSIDGPDCFSASEKTHREYIVSLMVGYAAEIKADPKCRKRAWTCAGNDQRMAQRHILEFTHHSKDLRPWVKRAKLFVGKKKNWAAIQAVAVFLLEHKSLNGNLVEAIIEHSDGDLNDAEFEQIFSFWLATKADD